MFLSGLKLTEFKNYAGVQVNCIQGINCFTGENGAGKTNLLDAVYYLCIGKSRIGAADQIAVRHEGNFFRIEGRFTKDSLQHLLVLKYALRKKKIIELDNVPYSKLSEHVGRFPVVMIEPSDIELALGGSEERRSFIDLTLSQTDPVYLEQLIRYNKHLEQRNALLRNFAQQNNFDLTLLEAYSPPIEQAAKYIFEARTRFLERIKPALENYYAQISGQKEISAVVYTSPLQELDMGSILIKNLERDRILERTTSGIHRDDLVFELDGHPLKKFASQGQLKSYVLALKLAQYDYLMQETGRVPLLLLDDIFDKLDMNRVKQLFQLIASIKFNQVFVTDTQADRIKQVCRELDVPYQISLVAEGRVETLE